MGKSLILSYVHQLFDLGLLMVGEDVFPLLLLVFLFKSARGINSILKYDG